MTTVSDTIFALSSGRPPAGIAVVRVSGALAREALRLLVGRVPAPRVAVVVMVKNPETSEPIDQGLALWFPGPASATGEDVAELHVHGGRAVVGAILASLGRISGCRLAEPGEFTRRAFDNGKLDLTRVEGLADLIAADTEAQRRQALRQLTGLLGDRAEDWRKTLIEAQALVEASLDFSDEGDVPDDLATPARARAKALREEIAGVLADGGRGERLRDGLTVAIAGPPNVGKSSLLNRIVRREAAIVSPIAGTTRDVVEVHLDLGGWPVTLLDTAGLRDSDDPVEQEGIRRARARAGEADVVLWLVDSTGSEAPAPAEFSAKAWIVGTKADLGGWPLGPAGGGQVATSAKTGEGISALLKALEDAAAGLVGSGEPALVTRARHREMLEETVAALDRALAMNGAGREEIFAEELRLAARALGRLVGRVDVEEVLDAVFRDFCIGK
ncbi:tRNA uridine-5-carboxymethylaminomethyl(34) synthesis GTPase MnmE [Rhodovulum sp. PH10]|uniref:tRNA uridine-5-carboxymethylaminomethyl(34) synthesis GTPase MnmE n=1 Tax=Rhodovulum sp. PH10 TaxID=1187851 RepID=UPI00058ED717|nr:tRNA uridine-5-carboxymethylaminomethyl(34) synthesis GTPase MnmE [Rhodovulum sp. PH10]